MCMMFLSNSRPTVAQQSPNSRPTVAQQSQNIIEIISMVSSFFASLINKGRPLQCLDCIITHFRGRNTFVFRRSVLSNVYTFETNLSIMRETK